MRLIHESSYMSRPIFLLFILMLSVFSVFADVEKIEKLERKLDKATDTARVNILNELSGLYARSDLNHADSLVKEAYLLLQNIDYPKGKINNLNQLSYIKSSLGKYEEALSYAKKAIELSEILGDKQLIAQSFDQEFMVFFRKGENVEASVSAEKANNIAQEIGDKNLIAKSYDNLGILRAMKGQHSEAIEYFMKSLTAYETLNDKSKISLALMHIGHTFELAGSYDKALEYLKRSLALNKEVADKYNEGWALVNIGVVYSRMNEIDTALIYYKKSLEIAEEINNHRLILTCLDNIGGKYSMQKDFEKANTYLQKAYRLSEESGQNSRTVYITGNLAENYLYMGQFDSARNYGEKQLELAIFSALISEQKVAYYILAQIYDSLGDYKRAHKALLEYITVNDTIFNRQKSEQIEALRESFETEKKEKEIDNLKAVNEAARFRNISYAGAAISFFILGGFLYYLQRSRINRNRLLLEKEKELDRMKSRFFANISHEFRTPLTLLLGPIEDMLSKAKEPAQNKKLKVMKRNTDRLLDLINQLLVLSKIESGKLKLNTTTSNIIPVIKGVSMSFHSMAEQKHIELELDIEPDHLEINYDKPKVETILTNLLSNAFKFTPDEGKITIQTRMLDKKQSQIGREVLSIEVIDSGSGIPMEDIDQIFNRFYQSDTNQLLQQEGSGIGLALTRELVELHEGTITATSTIGEGTRFIIELPTDLLSLVSIEADEQVIPAKKPEVWLEEYGKEEAPEVVENNRKPLVLLIEDHDDVRHYVKEILQDTYQVVNAKDGEEGIISALEIIPDLIISDVMMPKKDGYEVCDTLKNDEKTSHIPVILLTAKSDSADKITGLKTRADDYVTKPFVPKELLARIENLIESRRQLREKYRNAGSLRPKDIAVNSIDEQFLNKLMEIVELHMGDEQFGVEQLGDELSMSRTQLYRKLKALISQGPNQFIRTFRLQRAHDLLKQKAATAAEISFQVGFSSPSYFAKCFHDQFGYSPSEVPG